MLRVGHPTTLSSEVQRVMPPGVELVALPDGLDQDVDIDVWIPDPYPTRALRILPHLRGVRLILCLMAGTDWLPASLDPQITICNAHGAHNISTAEWVVSAIFTLIKHVPLFLDIQHSADWRRRREATRDYQQITRDTRPLHPAVMIEELTGKKVLIVGHGAIGQEIERMLAPFHIELVRIARRARSEPIVHAASELNRLIPDAEIIILILPLTEETQGIFGEEQFALMRQGALLVNAARGPIVQTDSLVAALQSGRIRAALDVTDPEPLPPDHPLWRCSNVFITPHVAASTPQFAARALAIAADELRRYMAGEPLRNAVQAGT
jgi:phosphoglycerate dehydrogenase-like enzyme